MTVSVKRDNGMADAFGRSADHYIQHTDGSLEVIRGGTAPPQTYPPGGWIAVSGDGARERPPRRLLRLIARLFGVPTSTGP